MANPIDMTCEPKSREEKFLSCHLNKIKAGEAGPEYVQWLCSHKCNFRCAHCGTGAAEATPGELTTKEAIKMIDDLADMGTKLLSVTGGEPIIRDDIFEVLGHAKDRGIMVGFVTNGYDVAKKKDQIAKLEPDSVLVSIDGYRENHDKIRGVPDAYKRAMDALDIFQDIGVRMRGVSMVFLEANEHDIPKIVDEALEHGAKRMRVQAVVPEGRAKEMENKRDEIYRLMKLILELKKAGKPVNACEGLGYLGPLEEKLRDYPFLCGCGYTTFTINEVGLVQGCPAIDFPELNEGNIRETSIKDLWLNSFDRYRKTLYQDLPEKCQDCKHLYNCRGGCWLHRVNGEFCFVDIAERVAEEML